MREYYFANLGITVRENGQINCGTVWSFGKVPEMAVYKMVHSPVTLNSYYVHRLVAKAFVRNPSPSQLTHVDHIDRSKSDEHSNAASNLRWVNRHLNSLNRLTKNYEYQKRFQNYKTKIKHDGSVLCLGWYKTSEDAQKVVNAWKEVKFRLKYLSYVTNDHYHWTEVSNRAFLLASKTTFAQGVAYLNLRASRHRSLRKALRVLLASYSEASANVALKF